MLLRSIRDPYLPGASCAPSQQGRVSRHSGNPCTLNLARRLEAVGRVRANPQRHILRVARYLARLPKDMLDEDFALPPNRRFWEQGREAFTGAVRILLSAIRAHNLCHADDPEPG
jgi:hypothetical protein